MLSDLFLEWLTPLTFCHLTGPPSETYTFDIPENVMVDVRLIADWLSNHNSDAYMTTYARLRAGILVRWVSEHNIT